MASMPRAAAQLRDDALRIWQAGLEAVRSERLVAAAVRVEEHWLHVADEPPIDLNRVGRIAVVGAGKAGAGMAAALEQILGPTWSAAKQLTGWVNVPNDCVRPLGWIHLHAARPAGRNEPTVEGVAGAEETLRIVGSLASDDLCIALISGGGSALLPLPVEGISLADKLAVTRHLSAAGANIAQLNIVRKQLSRIKGGGLARACRAGRLIALIISDVPGDPLDVIASGPTVEDHSIPQQALDVLRRFDPNATEIPASVYETLKRKAVGVRPLGGGIPAAAGRPPEGGTPTVGGPPTRFAGTMAWAIGMASGGPFSAASSASTRPRRAGNTAACRGKRDAYSALLGWSPPQRRDRYSQAIKSSTTVVDVASSAKRSRYCSTRAGWPCSSR